MSPRPRETLGLGQDSETVGADLASTHLRDNAFVPENLNDWLRSDHVGLRQMGTAHHPRSRAAAVRSPCKNLEAGGRP